MHHASPSPQSRWTARRLTVWGTGLLVLSWFIYAYTMSTPGLIDRAGRFKGTDHIYFFVMGSLMEDGRADDLYSPDAHLAEGRRRIDPSLALYAPYSNYGPQIAWAFMPLARLSYAGSLTLFLLFTAVCYALAVWLIWRDLPELARYGPLVALLAAASPLFLSLFRYAQLSAITLLLFSLALAAIRRDRRFLAGIALGTMIFKPTLGVLVGITLIAAGEWRIVAGAAAAATAQVALAWSVSSTAVMREYVDVLWRLLRNPSLVQIHPTEVHSLRGFLQLLIPQSPLVGLVSLLGTLAMLAAALHVWRSRCELGVRWGVLVLLTILASPHLSQNCGSAAFAEARRTGSSQTALADREDNKTSCSATSGHLPYGLESERSAGTLFAIRTRRCCEPRVQISRCSKNYCGTRPFRAR